MAEVRLIVNGTKVSLDVEPRLTLADALRHRMRLTGTHLGCEHGVCGACTVLIDGHAARSCLTFCVQADGHEVTTVEALGSPDDLHPLQLAFRRHHGLQCGFCTPGFLMSAYELLCERPGELDDEQRLREELSGVLCRCTGYAGIVEAVREVAAAHPDGPPAPKALGRPLSVRVGAEPPTAARQPAAPAPVAWRSASELMVPTGAPNETVHVTSNVSASPQETWALLEDFPRMSRCMPGVELDTEAGDDTYSGRVRVHLGPMRMNFAGAARVLERDSKGRRLRAVAAGRDPSGSGIQALVTLSAHAASDGGATLRAEAGLYLSGRAAQFGRSLAGDVSRQLFTEFAACVERTLRSGEAVAPARMAGGGLAWRLLRAQARALLRRIFGRKQES
ncbi:MAG: 2Fe-2S iron-sulfur cluster binding domain-containing protein [Solirubrobacterales bacterium]|nr:2Fe-2S iron-sulfur cluster binding domain-containing protein [Solirubrobacterales bacterium]